jgi:hypothetical protein
MSNAQPFQSIEELASSSFRASKLEDSFRGGTLISDAQKSGELLPSLPSTSKQATPHTQMLEPDGTLVIDLSNQGVSTAPNNSLQVGATLSSFTLVQSEVEIQLKVQLNVQLKVPNCKKHFKTVPRFDAEYNFPT